MLWHPVSCRFRGLAKNCGRPDRYSGHWHQHATGTFAASNLARGSHPDGATPRLCRYRAAQVLVCAERQPSSQGVPPEVALSTQASQAACMGWGPCRFATPTLGLKLPASARPARVPALSARAPEFSGGEAIGPTLGSASSPEGNRWAVHARSQIADHCCGKFAPPIWDATP